MGIHGRCRDPPVSHGGGAHAGGGGCLEEVVIQWEIWWREEASASRLEQPVLEGVTLPASCGRVTHVSAVLGGVSAPGGNLHCRRCGLAAAHEIRTMLEKIHLSGSGKEEQSRSRGLRLTEGLHLKTADWTVTSVNFEEQGAWLVAEGEKRLQAHPAGDEILPGTLVNNPGRIALWLRCAHPPTYLPKNQIVAQIIPTWGFGNISETPKVCPVQAITEERPRVEWEFSVGGEALYITGLLDTGADVTVVPEKDWPSHWALQNVARHVQGVGGLQLARQSKGMVQIKGPNGQLANIRPFVLNYKEPLLGRDLMSQWGVKIDIPDPSSDFSVAVTEKRPTQKLNWLTDSPVWVEQWPLSKEKLKALEELVEEQLAKDHIVETNSPWNSLVFVIKKPGKDKWRLLHDLRQINNVIEDMGSLQPGMPSPTMLPENWKLAVIDIKDCFFQIPLHPDDAPRFAFSVPTINRAAPRRRYHWRVLPQGMKNSPVICQWYVASLLSPVRAAADKAIIYHYMDDVLVCAPSDDDLSHALDLTINSLIAAGFELQDEKVQRMPPWRYLGLEISKRTIVPQKLEIKTKISTLADLHQLCGSLNWELVAELIRKARSRIRDLASCDFKPSRGRKDPPKHQKGPAPTTPGTKTEPPSIRLARALFTINFLNCSFEGLNPPVVRHFGASPQFHTTEKPPVMIKDPETGKTDGPHGLVTWGRGYACVSTPTGPKWIPSKWVRPYVPKVSGTH
ncbi:hypothetical protein DUI87_08444 [Hirundo rustica rustica]|uniref:ribonuclease H n=1 Tax=Hirundo rustica rustica TaxID=333673 RepID=A0A3M0KSF6_HIRRU|nr:hypothetical protein DUI87_08444 [Hirundo rustica rustica]